MHVPDVYGMYGIPPTDKEKNHVKLTQQGIMNDRWE